MHLCLPDSQTYCIDAADHYPNVYFNHNVVRKNRARGILISSRKPMCIYDNSIISEGAAIRISGDMSSWFESGNVDQVFIKHNHLATNNQFGWGKGIIDIDPEIYKFEKDSYYHGEFVIEGNSIVIKKVPLVYGRSIQCLKIINNTVDASKSNLEIHDANNMDLTLEHIKNLEVHGNCKQNNLEGKEEMISERQKN